MVDRLPRIVLVLIVTAGLTITLAGIRATADIIGPALLALVLTITVYPVRRWLVKRGMAEWLTSLLVVTSIYVLLFLVVAALVYSIGRLAVLLPQYAPEIEDNMKSVGDWLESIGIGADTVEAAGKSLDMSNVVGLATSVFSAMLSILSSLFFIITVALFMAFDTRSVEKVASHLRESKPHFVEALESFSKGTRTYMGVTTGFGLIVAVIDGIALQLMGVPGAFVWAVLAFVTNFIPNIGFVIGVIPPAVIGLLEGGPGLMLGVIAVYSVINVVIQSVIQPRYVGDAVGLTPTITMLSLVFWAWAIGALGALLAVPLSLLARALLIEADPDARWALPLVSGRVAKDKDPPDEESPSGEESAAEDSAQETKTPAGAADGGH
jgi:predicted PurR-regulated permease PerM